MNPSIEEIQQAPLDSPIVIEAKINKCRILNRTIFIRLEGYPSLDVIHYFQPNEHHNAFHEGQTIKINGSIYASAPDTKAINSKNIEILHDPVIDTYLGKNPVEN